MRRFFMGLGAVALLLVGSQSAEAGPRWGAGVGFGGGFGVNYSTRIGNNGFLSVGYGRGGLGFAPGFGYGYTGYGWAPAYGYGFARPAFYGPAYVAPGYGYGYGPGFGYYRGSRWGW